MKNKLERSKSMKNVLDSKSNKSPRREIKSPARYRKSPERLYENNTTYEKHQWLRKLKDKTINGTKYTGFQFVSPLKVNDCLLLAESMACKVLHYNKAKSIYREEKTNLLFGLSEKQNMKIASNKASRQNNKANPTVGHAYAIVERKLEGGVPYHIAFVLYKDEKTNITIEADANDANLTFPVFDMYSTGNCKI